MSRRYQVLSPDGLPIAPRLYPTLTAAELALVAWAQGFRQQGYYASVRGRIALEDLIECCRIVRHHATTKGSNE